MHAPFSFTARLDKTAVMVYDWIMRRRRKRRREDSWKRTVNRRSDTTYSRVASVIVVSVPLAVVCLVMNIIMRMKDVYSYSLSASGIIGKTTISTSEEEILALITNFMNGKTDEFALMENSPYDPEQIFSALDQQVMTDTRAFLHIVLVIGLIALAVSAIAYFLLIRWRVKEIFMKRFKISVVVFAVLEVFNILTVCIEPVRKAVYGSIIPMDLPDGDNLALLLGEAFPRQVIMFETIAGVAAMALIGYLTWYVAGRRKMFRRF